MTGKENPTVGTYRFGNVPATHLMRRVVFPTISSPRTMQRVSKLAFEQRIITDHPLFLSVVLTFRRVVFLIVHQLSDTVHQSLANKTM